MLPRQSVCTDARSRLIGEILDLNRRAHTLAFDIVGPSMMPGELTMRQLRVLNVVAREPGLATNELSQRLGVSAPTASGIVERLTDKGLVERTDDPSDRRVHRLNLTDAGAELIRNVDTMLERLIDTVLPLVSMEDLEAMRRASEILLDVLIRAAEATKKQAGLESD